LLGVLDLPELHRQHVVELPEVLSQVIDTGPLADAEFHFREAIRCSHRQRVELLVHSDQTGGLLVVPELCPSEERPLLLHKVIQ
jgi:hypothetical protein